MCNLTIIHDGVTYMLPTLAYNMYNKKQKVSSRCLDTVDSKVDMIQTFFFAV